MHRGGLPSDDVPFVPLTRDSLQASRRTRASSSRSSSRRTLRRIFAKKREAQKAGGHDDDVEEGPFPDPTLETGCRLPLRLQDDMPPELVGVPLQEIDEFYYNRQTFIVVNKGMDIYRFSSSKAIWLMDPFNVLRRSAIYLLTHSFFSLFIMVTILANCVVMSMPSNESVEASEVVFTTIYSMEAGVKIMARGFVLAPFTYLRDAWNCLDFVVIVLAYITMGVDLGNMAVLRTFRVLRALKTVAIVPGLKTIVATVIESVKNLFDVIILTVFSLSIFALISLQIYMGVLRQKCILNFNSTSLQLNATINISHAIWNNWNNNSDHWLVDENSAMGDYKLCGNSSGASKCPENYTCIGGYGPNPNYGYTNFDSFGFALLASFRIMTQDYWENLFQLVLRTSGSVHLLYFVVAIFMNSYYLLNLILAIVAMSYDQLQQRVEQEQRDEASAIAERAHRQESMASAAEAAARGKGDGNSHSPSPRFESADSIGSQLCLPAPRVPGFDSIGLILTGASTHHPPPSADSVSLPSSSPKGRRYGSRDTYQVAAVSECGSALRFADDSGVTTPVTDDVSWRPAPSSRNSYTSHTSPRSFHSHGDLLVTAPPRRFHPTVSFCPRKSPSLDDVQAINSLRFGRSYSEANKPSSPTENTSIEMKDLAVLNRLIDESMRSKNAQVEESEEDGLTLRDRLGAAASRCVDLLCVWDCCWVWIEFQKLLKLVVFDAFMELFITLCILVNTFFMALDHHQMDPALAAFLRSGNYFFTAIFTIEATMKMIALSPKFYFKEGWNTFDFIIVVLSLVELGLSGVRGLSVLRSFRLLRVFKLAKSWPTLNQLITIMGRTVGAIGNLTIVLCIIVFIFAVMGMQLFGKNYIENKDRLASKRMPRWNFTDFMHSIMIVFRVLCGEWIESMWDCLKVGDSTCVPFFLATVVIANLVVLSLFLALLLSSFGADNLSSASNSTDDSGKLLEALNRLKLFKRCVQRHLKLSVRAVCRHLICCISGSRPQSDDGLSSVSRTKGDGEDSEQASDIPGNGPISIAVPGDAAVSSAGQIPVSSADQRPVTFADQAPVSSADQRPISSILQKSVSIAEHRDLLLEKRQKSNGLRPSMHGDIPRSLTIHSFNHADDFIGQTEPVQRRHREGRTASVVIEDANSWKDDESSCERQSTSCASDVGPEDCFTDPVYRCCPGCRGRPDSPFWQRWAALRAWTFRLIENKYFETAVITMILLSSLALALEDVNLRHNPILQDVLYYLDRIFTVIFFLEMLVKWLAMGFKKYFTNAWCWLDFLIVMVSLTNLIASMVGADGVAAFKTMRTLRALRPLRAMSRMQGMKVVVNALFQAIPSIFNVFLVCLIFWLIFAIVGVQFFAGKFYKCVNADGHAFSIDVVNNQSQCTLPNSTWENSVMNFDHVGSAYLALFQVATFKGWMPIMADATDARDVGLQPSYETDVYKNIYFIVFIIFGAFFTLNMFIGVIIENFNAQKKNAGGSLDLFMTKEQKKYYNAMKKMAKKKPQKAIPRPRFRLQRILYDICVNRKFEILIMVLIGLNMIAMMLDHHGMSSERATVLERVNMFFIAVFTAEALLKLMAFRWYYFKDSWNLFDFAVVILSILGVVLKDIFTQIFNVSPTLLRVVRVAKVTRVLRLIKGAKGIRTLLFAFAMSAPALLNIIMLLFLMMFIYAIFGMSFFMNVKVPMGGLDETFNFQTFINSFILLFQMMTSAGWDGVLLGLMNEEDCLPPDPAIGEPGNCGNKTLAISYLVSYLIISFLIVINMYIAVILENYSQAKEDVQDGLTDDDYDMYYDVWQRFDPCGTKFVPLEQLSDLLDELEPPLQVQKPNKYKIIAMDIAICQGDLVCCVDILDALTKDFFSRKGTAVHETAVDNVTAHRDMPEYRLISSTLWRRYEEQCAARIQRAWRHFHNSR